MTAAAAHPAPPARPVVLRILSALVLLEVLALLAAALGTVIRLIAGSQLPGPTAFLGVLALSVAAVLLGAVRGLWRGARWARSPLLTFQILLAVLAIGWIGVEPAAGAIAALLLALTTAVLLLLPSLTAWTTHPRSPV